MKSPNKIAIEILNILNKEQINFVEYGTYFIEDAPEEKIEFYYQETDRQMYEKYKEDTGIDLFEIAKCKKLENENEKEKISINLPSESNKPSECVSLTYNIGDMFDNMSDDEYEEYLKILSKFEKYAEENKYIEQLNSSINKVFFEKFGHSVHDILHDLILNFDIEDFLTKALYLIKSYDAYGSGLYLSPEGKKFHLFSNYDNGSDTKNHNVCMSLMFVDDKSRDIFLADVEYKKDKNCFEYVDMQKAKFPKELWNIGISSFFGKRSFYWWIEKHIVNLRCNTDTIKKISKEYLADKSFHNNLSGDRIKINLLDF